MSIPSWTPRDIVQALHARGWTQRRLARELAMSPSAVSYGLQTGSSFKLRAKVSDILTEDEITLWPTRFPPQWRACDRSK